MTHTPGPWRVRATKKTRRIFAPNFINGEICSIRMSPYPHLDPNDRREADARLIAAAPELLEAVQELLATHPAAYREAGKIDNRTDNAARIARVAIAKATGNGQ